MLQELVWKATLVVLEVLVRQALVWQLVVLGGFGVEGSGVAAGGPGGFGAAGAGVAAGGPGGFGAEGSGVPGGGPGGFWRSRIWCARWSWRFWCGQVWVLQALVGGAAAFGSSLLLLLPLSTLPLPLPFKAASSLPLLLHLPPSLPPEPGGGP